MQNAKVLIVDDEADVVQVLKLRLEMAGYDAATARDGAEALKMLQQIQPDLILADLMMPNLDGLELTRRIRQNPSWFSIQVLLFSCHDDPVARNLALELGALDYLSKTLGAHSIVSRINEILAVAKSVEGAPECNYADYGEAEQDLMAQLRAISRNSAGALPVRTGIPKLKPRGPQQSSGTADGLWKLDKALQGRAKAGQHPDSDR